MSRLAHIRVLFPRCTTARLEQVGQQWAVHVCTRGVLIQEQPGAAAVPQELLCRAFDGQGEYLAGTSCVTSQALPCNKLLLTEVELRLFSSPVSL